MLAIDIGVSGRLLLPTNLCAGQTAVVLIIQYYIDWWRLSIKRVVAWKLSLVLWKVHIDNSDLLKSCHQNHLGAKQLLKDREENCKSIWDLCQMPADHSFHTIVDPWTTQVWTVRVHLYVDFFQSITDYALRCATLYRGVEHPRILVSGGGVLEPILHGYQGQLSFRGVKSSTWSFDCVGQRGVGVLGTPTPVLFKSQVSLKEMEIRNCRCWMESVYFAK